MTPDDQEIAAAVRVRTAWMRLIGLDEDEIQLHDREYPAVLLSAELDQLDAAVANYLCLPEHPPQNPPSGPSCGPTADTPDNGHGTTTSGLQVTHESCEPIEPGS